MVCPAIHSGFVRSSYPRSVDGQPRSLNRAVLRLSVSTVEFALVRKQYSLWDGKMQPVKGYIDEWNGNIRIICS
jgi:hypothetical protein